MFTGTKATSQELVWAPTTPGAVTKTCHANRLTHTNMNVTDHFDVLEAGEDEVFQELAADPSRSNNQHLACGQGVH